jgi:hypothetical protein
MSKPNTHTVSVDVPEVDVFYTDCAVRCGRTATTISKAFPHKYDDARWMHGIETFDTFNAALAAAKTYVEKKETVRLVQEQVYSE